MDFGIKGRNALVCAASKGLGFGSALALAKEGVNVTITARGAATLEAAAKQIRAAAPGVTVKTVAGDITTEAGRADALVVARPILILVHHSCFIVCASSCASLFLYVLFSLVSFSFLYNFFFFF